MSNQDHYLQLFKNTTAVIMDMDGVLTDGTLLTTEKGDELRSTHIRDGHAIKSAIEKGLLVAVISGSTSEGVKKRLQRLGVKEIHMRVLDKEHVVKKLQKKYKFDIAAAVYIGDDVADMKALKMCGIPACPSDAIAEILTIAKYISPFSGGHGCVRDILEKVLKLQGKWETE